MPDNIKSSLVAAVIAAVIWVVISAVVGLNVGDIVLWGVVIAVGTFAVTAGLSYGIRSLVRKRG
jgi:hypothetical protein